MIRLVLLIVLLLTSLLTVFKAPAYYLWLLAIMVSEYPLIFAGITAVITALGYRAVKYQMAGTVIGIITLLLFLSPIVRAYIIGKMLKQEMDSALGSSGKLPVQPPFSFLQLFKQSKALPHQTITYVNYADTALTMDFYPTQKAGKKPCVIVIHGGSWSSGDSKQLPELNSYLSAKGYHVASINYRLSPKYKTPAPLEDVQNALKYLHAHADSLQVDTNNLVLLGRSAGAQIALLAAYTLHNNGIKAVVDFYGPADMVWGYSMPASKLIMDSRGVMERYIGGPYQQMPQKYAGSSPLLYVNKQSVPTLIIHGQNDVLVAYEHSRRLNEKLQQNGIKQYWLQLLWATHGFDYNLNGPGGQLSTYAVEAFLNTVTGN